MNRTRTIWTLACLTVGIGTASPAFATERIVSVNSGNTLQCSRGIGAGDYEFNGNGPDTNTFLQLGLGNGDQTVTLRVFLDQVETKADWTNGRVDKSNIFVGNAPADVPHFKQFFARDSSGTWGWITLSPNSAFWYTTWHYIDTNTSLDSWSFPDFWVARLDINGDTPGPDISSSNCATLSTDSYIRVTWDALYFWASS